MILILAIWAMVIGYTLVFLGLDKLSSSPKNYSFGAVFFPQFLGSQVTSDQKAGGIGAVGKTIFGGGKL